MKTSPLRRRIMQAVKSEDTSIELQVRYQLHSLGYRYRLHDKKLPGRPDIIFSGRKKVVFIHGCFWHGHQCARGNRVPKSNRDYWVAKIARNRSRDLNAVRSLKRNGWASMIVWECKLQKNPKTILRKLVEFLGPTSG